MEFEPSNDLHIKKVRTLVHEALVLREASKDAIARGAFGRNDQKIVESFLEQVGGGRTIKPVNMNVGHMELFETVLDDFSRSGVADDRAIVARKMSREFRVERAAMLVGLFIPESIPPDFK